MQGVGGALLTPGSLAILEASFRPQDRSRAIGAWSGLSGVASAIGPFLGGWLVDAASWRWIFLINLPLSAFVVVVAARHVPESLDPEADQHIDGLGAALIALALGGVSWGLIAAGDDGWGAVSVWGSLLVGVVSFVAFVVNERRSRHPMLPPTIFSSAQFRAANLVTATVYGALGGVFFLLVVQLQIVLGYSAIEAGAASFPITILMLALSARSGAMAARIGPRLQMTVGPLLVAVGDLLMTRIDAGVSYVGAVLPAVLVMGLGLATTVAPLTSTALSAVADRYAGVASGVNTTVARAAQLAAVAALPLAAGITGTTYEVPADLSAGFQTAMVITAAPGRDRRGDRLRRHQEPRAGPRGRGGARAAGAPGSSAVPRGRRSTPAPAPACPPGTTPTRLRERAPGIRWVHPRHRLAAKEVTDGRAVRPSARRPSGGRLPP